MLLDRSLSVSQRAIWNTYISGVKSSWTSLYNAYKARNAGTHGCLHLISIDDPDCLHEHDEEEAVRGDDADRLGGEVAPQVGGELERVIVQAPEPHQAQHHQSQDLIE